MSLPLINLLDGYTSIQLLVLVFLAILFLQSGLDKVFNYKSNMDWLNGHFAKSPLKGSVGLMMPTIMILEVAAGVCCAVGIVQLLTIDGNSQIGLLGAQLSAISLVALFFGQRIAQDYQGASTLTTYFLIACLGMYVLG